MKVMKAILEKIKSSASKVFSSRPKLTGSQIWFYQW